MTTPNMQQPGYDRPDFHRSQVKLDLTMEEMMAWKECMKDHSVFNSVPIILAHAAIGYGVFSLTPFRAKAKYAALAGGMLGLIVNRVAASEKCLSKMLSSSNIKDQSNMRFGDSQIRDQRRLYKSAAPTEVPSSEEQSSTEIMFDDYPPMNSYDTYSSLNDGGNVPATSEDIDLTEPINLQKGATYEELRHKNREEYYHQKSRQYAAFKQPYQPTETKQQAPAKVPVREETKYGDVWG